MIIDYNKKYFLMSFRFDKEKLEDFGLSKSNCSEDVFVDNNDKSEWIRSALYDFGWGNENGFIRLPKLDFLGLWDLLTNSHLLENKYGAAYLLENEYPNALLDYLLVILNDSDSKITDSLKEVFMILKLDSVKNRSDIVGKSFAEINNSLEKWKLVSELIKNRMN
jgi:hypothetical protein